MNHYFKKFNELPHLINFSAGNPSRGCEEKGSY